MHSQPVPIQSTPLLSTGQASVLDHHSIMSFLPINHYSPSTARPIAIRSAATQDQTPPCSIGSQASAMTDISDSLRPSPPMLSASSSTATPYTIRTPANTASANMASPSSPTERLAPIKPFPHRASLLINPSEPSGSRATSQQDLAHGDEPMQVDQSASSSVNSEDSHRAARQASRSSISQDLRSEGDSDSAYSQPTAHLAHFDGNVASRSSTSADPYMPFTDLSDPPSLNELGPFRPWFGRPTTRQREVDDPYANYERATPSWSSPAPHVPLAPTVSPTSSTLRPVQHRPALADTSIRVPRIDAEIPFPNINSLPAPANHLAQSTSPNALERRIDGIEARYRQRAARGSPTYSDFAATYDTHRPRPYEVPTPASRSRPPAPPQAHPSSLYNGQATWLNIPSVPPPRNTNRTLPSPYTGGLSYPDQSPASTLFAPVQPPSSASFEAGRRSRYLQERLGLLDALRAETHRSSIPEMTWHNQPVETRPDFPLDTSAASYRAAHLSQSPAAYYGAPSGSSVTAATMPQNMIRPSLRRWLSFDEGSRGETQDVMRERDQEDAAIGAWHRHVNNSIGRRTSQVHSEVPEENVWGDYNPPGFSTSHDRQNRAARRPDPQPALWGELLGDSNTNFDPLNLRDGFHPSEGAEDHITAHLAARIPRDSRTAGVRGMSDFAFGQASDVDHLMGDTMGDHTHFGPMHAYANLLRRRGASPVNLKITPEMTKEEVANIVEMVVKGITRVASGARRRAADSVLETVSWGAFGEREGMPRDEFCSVCHDEYTEETKIAVTPCNHMYHKGCLETWLKTPNTSSCPMCRRDLAVLALLSKMVPSKTKADAVPIWMAA